MGSKKRLTGKQLAVIDDLFSGQFDEQAVLEKHKIDRRVYNKWQGEELFTMELAGRMDSAQRQSELIIARYASLAAAKLVQLTESENQETARKACLDIITLPGLSSKRFKTDRDQEKVGEEMASGEKISQETAAEILAVLARAKSPQE